MHRVNSNVLKHSQANVCQVSLIDKEGIIELKVVDDGQKKGNADQVNLGFGLSHMANRIEALNGHFNFDLNETGCTVSISIPAIKL